MDLIEIIHFIDFKMVRYVLSFLCIYLAILNVFVVMDCTTAHFLIRTSHQVDNRLHGPF